MLKNFVIVKHWAGNGKFLFQVPKKINLETGDNVICDTSHSPKEPGICCCDSFLADPKTVCPLFGTTPEKMWFVVGKVEYERFAEAMEDEEEEEREREYERENG